MPDNQDPQNQDPPQDPPKQDPPKQDPPSNPDAEKVFWDKLDGRLDAFFDRKLKQVRENQTGNSRTGGRSTITTVLSDLMFGKPPVK